MNNLCEQYIYNGTKELEFIASILKQRKRDLKLQKYYSGCDIEYERGLIRNLDIDKRRNIEEIKNETNNIDKIILGVQNNTA
eukprot:gene6710-10875_t